MQLILRITNGSQIGKKLLLRHGQIAKVGSTDWSDFSVADDPSLAEFHFEVRCEPNACSIADRDRNGVLVDGQPVTSADLRDGQMITAGQTTFEVQIQGAPTCCHHQEECDPDIPVAAETQEPEQEAPVESPPARPESLSDICDALGLGDQAKELAQRTENGSVGDLIDVFEQNGQLTHAVTLAAATFERKLAIQWGMECLQTSKREVAESEAESAKAVEAWLADPTDENGRIAEAIATENDFEGAFHWLAVATFWAGPSIAPAGQPVVAPPWHLPSRGIVAALTLDATSDPDTADDRYRSFVEQARSHLAAGAN